MRSIEDKGCVTVSSNGTTPELSSATSCMSFEFHKSSTNGNRTTSQHRTSLGKQPTPSKWDDAQKWLVNLSRGEKNPSKSSPRNSNADDRRLIAPVPKKDYSSGDEEGDNIFPGGSNNVETKNVDCDESSSVWMINKPQQVNNKSKSSVVVRSICVRDMGTEMTPIASQEPSRAATPIRGATRSPISSPSLTPVRSSCPPPPMPLQQNGPNPKVIATPTIIIVPKPEEEEEEEKEEATRQFGINGSEELVNNVQKFNVVDNQSNQPNKVNPMELRALAWDEAERAKYTARYKREEIKIQAWENHEKRKAEMEMRKVEVKAERLKSRAQEKYTNKVASTRRIAEEKRANADAKLNEMAVKTSEKADYLRTTGHLPSSFLLKFRLPSFCW